MNPNFSVVICAYTEERWEALCAAVASLQRQTRPADEIIVSVDHNPALLARARAALPEVKVVENRQARGLSGARNSGVAAAQGAVIAFMDDDAIAAPDWLAQLEAGFKDPSVVGVGGVIEPLWEAGRPSWFPAEFDWVVGCTYLGLPTQAAPVRNLIGANMAFRREVFEQLGGFRLGYGCDETDFCIQVRQSWPHLGLLYQPTARVQHQVPASRASGRYFFKRCYFEGGSKAVVSALVGARDGLASERLHVLRTLPQGVGRGLRDALRGQPAGVMRAGAIVAGLAVTGAGYLVGLLFVRQAASRRGWEMTSSRSSQPVSSK